MLTEYFQQLITFMQSHPTWAGLITFWIALLESLPIFGYLLPGSVILTGIGLLIGAKILPLVAITVWAILGAIVGDGLSYLLGLHYQENIKNLVIFSRLKAWIENGEQFFNKHGGKSVFLGRFFGPLRSIIPVIAGMMNMPRNNFLIANISSAVLWAPAHLLPGVALGLASLTFSPKQVGHFVVGLLVLLLVVWLGGMILRFMMNRLIYRLNRFSRSLWNKMQTLQSWPVWSKILYGHSAYARDYYQLSLLLGIFLLFILFIFYSYSKVTHGWVTNYDIEVKEFFAHWQQPWLNPVAVYTAFLGDRHLLILLACILFIYCAARKALYPGICLLIAVACASGSVYLLKFLFHNARPEMNQYVTSIGSYPSGHSVLSVVTYGFTSVLARTELKPNTRWFFYRVVIVLITSIIFSRLFFGVHWLSDVVGSLFLAGSILLASIFMLRRKPKTKISPIPFLILTFTLVMGLSGALTLDYYFSPPGHKVILRYF